MDLRLVLKGIVACVSIMAAVDGRAQLMLKNNLLYDASLTPNIAAEVQLGRRWSADVGYGLHPWSLSGDKKLRHWLLQPEVRYWFCQTGNGMFVGAHLMGGEFNAGGVRLPLGIAPCLRHNRYEGWYAGGGLVWGWQWPLSRHFSVEAALGVGYDYLSYRKYPCRHCGTLLDEGHYHYVGPTKIAINLIYNINSGTKARRAYEGYGAHGSYEGYGASGAHETAATPILGGSATLSSVSLAAAGGSMVLTMAVGLDSLRLRHAQTVVLRPVLRRADGEEVVRFRPLLVNSADQHVMHLRGIHNDHYPDALEVERRNGHAQTVSYLDEVDYAQWMDQSYVLEIEEDLCGCGDLVADNTTPLMRHEPAPDPLTLIALTDVQPSASKPARNLHGTAFINFVVNRWEMRPDYMDNARELRKITDTLSIMVADRNISVDRIMIHGWASPESPYDHNRMLAQNRAQALTDYLKTVYQLPASVFAPAEATPENWQGLLEVLDTISDTRLPHKADIRRTAADVVALQAAPVVNGQAIDRAEQALRSRHRADYDYLLTHVYPHLRRSDYEITFRVREFSLDEARQIYLTHPDQLSLYEFWQVANTFEPYGDDYNRCLQRAFTYHPDSAVAALNVANAALRQGDTTRAAVLLERAGDSAEALQARAVLALLEQRYDVADRLLDQAAALGLDVARNRAAVARLRRDR